MTRVDRPSTTELEVGSSKQQQQQFIMTNDAFVSHHIDDVEEEIWKDKHE